MVRGICFEYIGDEDQYIDNLETIIEFGKGIYFTEKLYDINDIKAEKNQRDSEGVINCKEVLSLEVCREKSVENQEQEEMKAETNESDSRDEKLASRTSEPSVGEFKENDAPLEKPCEILFDINVLKECSEQKSENVESTGKASHFTYKCDQCDASYAQSQGLLYHKRKVHQGMFFQCELCGKKLSKEADVKAHLKKVHGGIKHTCPTCGKTYNQKENLNVHMQSVHEKIKYKCNECPKETTQLGALGLHMKTMHANVNYYCEVCDFKANTTYRLSKHKETFHLEKPCMQCDQTFNTNRERKIHIRRAHNIEREREKWRNGRRLLECSHCDYKQFSKKAMKIHMQSLHKSIRIMTCDKCDHKTTSKSGMHSHKRIAHGDKFFVCSLCDYTAKLRGYLNLHMKQKHRQATVLSA